MPQALITGNKADAVTVTGLVVNGPIPALPKKARMAIRAAVKQLEDSVGGNSGQLSAEDDKEMRRVMGRIGRLIACGHPEGQRLKARVRAVLKRAPLLERYVSGAEHPILMTAGNSGAMSGMTTSPVSIDLQVDLPWEVG